MASWLYPISTKRKDKYFELDGETEPVTVESFKELIYNGRIVEDSTWNISCNFAKIQINDGIYIYTGHNKLGIIGYASVLNKTGGAKKPWSIELQFDLNKSKILLDQPIKAEIVQGWLGKYNTRNVVTDLNDFEEELHRLMPGQPTEVVENKLVDYIESEITATGQGYNNSQAIRKTVENHAMKRATVYYQSLGYQIKDVSLTSSYDLHCFNGDCRLLVEVKGTQSQGNKVFLTRNEVINARHNKGEVSLYILHSIQIDDQGEASGGTEFILHPWDVDQGTLKPLVYEYEIPT